MEKIRNISLGVVFALLLLLSSISFMACNDKEIEIYGFIDRRGKVLVKFQMIKTSDDLKRMRKEAEELIL